MIDRYWILNGNLWTLPIAYTNGAADCWTCEDFFVLFCSDPNKTAMARTLWRARYSCWRGGELWLCGSNDFSDKLCIPDENRLQKAAEAMVDRVSLVIRKEDNIKSIEKYALICDKEIIFTKRSLVVSDMYTYSPQMKLF